jgi:hypothetical protein
VAERFDEVEELLDRHARRLAKELGGLIVEAGEALRRVAETKTPTEPRSTGEPDATKEDLYREATRLGVPARSKMTKQELRAAVGRAQKGSR